jgi:glutamyl-tRNA reductase
MASVHNIAFLDWQGIADWHHFDWIICGTKFPDYLITKQQIPKHISPKLIIDLSVPRNVDPSIQDSGIRLLNIDQLMDGTLKVRFQQMHNSLCHAEEVVAEAAKYQIHLFNQKQLARESYVCA